MNNNLNLILEGDRYWLKNANIPISLIEDKNFLPQTKEGLHSIDLEITEGKITQIISSNDDNSNFPSVDLNKKIILPCFIDLHTHLDKGHIWERTNNPDGTFDSALKAAIADSEKYWQSEDVYRRMEFSIKCAYAHGTKAIRTHLDCFGKQAEISLSVFKSLQQKWIDKIDLQAVTLVSLDYYQTDAGVVLADKLLEVGGMLGGVAYSNPDLDSQLDTVFSLAKKRGLDLDFHADENGDRNSNCLRKIAEAAIRNKFEGQIICGHCCSLAVQSQKEVEETLKLVKEAKIGIVSLPMCNLYLQDRKPMQTPYWRGVTKVRELKQKGIPVTFASDNCRDPFYGFGDLDVLEVFQQAVRIAHLDTPYDNWINSVAKTGADLMKLPHLGRIKVGLPANLIIFKARYFSELLSRSQHDRIVLHQGKQIDTTLPDYEELDELNRD
jgi:cytosine/creatinine deaminase